MRNCEWRVQVDKVDPDGETIPIVEPRNERMVVWLNVNEKRNELQMAGWDGSEVVLERVKPLATFYVCSCLRVNDCWRRVEERKLCEDQPASRKRKSGDGRIDGWSGLDGGADIDDKQNYEGGLSDELKG